MSIKIYLVKLKMLSFFFLLSIGKKTKIQGDYNRNEQEK